ncbi:MAG: hypothetical protein JWQ11_377 [Rhizobacter sp.]|nr:hypothetical protein [Rhizobacter sp.]
MYAMSIDVAADAVTQAASIASTQAPCEVEGTQPAHRRDAGVQALRAQTGAWETSMGRGPPAWLARADMARTLRRDKGSGSAARAPSPLMTAEQVTSCLANTRRPPSLFLSNHYRADGAGMPV